jgi:hypothetical protein
MFIWFLFGISSSPTSTADIINCKILRWHISETRSSYKDCLFSKYIIRKCNKLQRQYWYNI